MPSSLNEGKTRRGPKKRAAFFRHSELIIFRGSAWTMLNLDAEWS